VPTVTNAAAVKLRRYLRIKDNFRLETNRL
jgi:hypothetical protein